jgi:hypothetical protein
VSPASLSLSGSATVPVTVTVSTTARSAIWLRPKPPAAPWIWVWFLAMVSAVGAATTRGSRLASERGCFDYAPQAANRMFVVHP